MDAVRVRRESGGCPLVFFLAPPADAKHTWLDKAKRLGVLHRPMDLHFVCRVFFDDLRNALSRASHVPPNPMMSSEFSLPIPVEKPRVSVERFAEVSGRFVRGYLSRFCSSRVSPVQQTNRAEA